MYLAQVSRTAARVRGVGWALEGLEQLVHNVLLMHLLKDVGADDVVQISVHVSARRASEMSAWRTGCRAGQRGVRRDAHSNTR
jgi:hypothetical protein